MKNSTISSPPSFQPPSNIRKLLVFLEEASLLEQIALLDDLSKQKIETQIYIKTEQISEERKKSVGDRLQAHTLSTFSMKDVSNILSQQSIGTHLFILGKWQMIQAIKEEAYHVGFSDDEIQTVGIGRKKEKVFCVKCYSYNSKKKEDYPSCQHCHTPLHISNHFSKRHNAYLGYINIG